MPVQRRLLQALILLCVVTIVTTAAAAPPSPNSTKEIRVTDDPLNEPEGPHLSQEAQEMAKKASENMARIFFWSAVGLFGGGDANLAPSRL